MARFPLDTSVTRRKIKNLEATLPCEFFDFCMQKNLTRTLGAKVVHRNVAWILNLGLFHAKNVDQMQCARNFTICLSRFRTISRS